MGGRPRHGRWAGTSTTPDGHCSITLPELLARLIWRDLDSWTVPCRDGRGRRARLRIGLTWDGIVITPSAPGPWELTALESGRLRGAVRDALLSMERLAGSEQISRGDQQPGGRGSNPDIAPLTGCPTPRGARAAVTAVLTTVA